MGSGHRNAPYSALESHGEVFVISGGAVWLDIEQELKERCPFNPIHEVLNSAEGGKLLVGVPQLTLPMNAGVPGNNYSATIADVQTGANVTIEPVDFECKMALVESSRMTHSCGVSGKILACRTPDLVIQYNVIPTKTGWKKDN